MLIREGTCSECETIAILYNGICSLCQKKKIDHDLPQYAYKLERDIVNQFQPKDPIMYQAIHAIAKTIAKELTEIHKILIKVKEQ